MCWTNWTIIIINQSFTITITINQNIWFLNSIISNSSISCSSDRIDIISDWYELLIFKKCPLTGTAINRCRFQGWSIIKPTHALRVNKAQPIKKKKKKNATRDFLISCTCSWVLDHLENPWDWILIVDYWA